MILCDKLFVSDYLKDKMKQLKNIWFDNDDLNKSISELEYIPVELQMQLKDFQNRIDKVIG